ncbi:MAG: histidine phosphatase family protein [Nannocystaceae bacterium]
MTAAPWQPPLDDGSIAVLLVRHGRTSFNAEGRFCGCRSDPPLDDRGREEAAALGERLGAAAQRVFASPQRRARETAAALGPRGREPTIVDDLRELDQGDLDGHVIAEALASPRYAAFMQAWRRDPGGTRVPGGESMEELGLRTAAALERIIGDARAGARLALVGHQMAHAALVCRLLGQPMRRWTDFQLANARAHLLRWDGAAWTLRGRDL